MFTLGNPSVREVVPVIDSPDNTFSLLYGLETIKAIIWSILQSKTGAITLVCLYEFVQRIKGTNRVQRPLSVGNSNPLFASTTEQSSANLVSGLNILAKQTEVAREA